jgi:LmbE family N-acetylglucosaminyl deacetylase
MFARRILILAPHPDDEIVACGIAAMRARTEGAEVFVLYLTTGVPPRESLWRWQRDGYQVRRRRRREEAMAVAAELQLTPIGFRDTPARRLRHDLDAAARDVAAALASCGANVLWVPAFEGAHQDHDAANALASHFAADLPVADLPVADLPVWEFAAYNYAGGKVQANRFADQRGGEIVIAATEAEAERKRRALAVYVSERGNLQHIGTAHEVGRRLPAHDYGMRPHPSPLFRERFHWVPFRHPRVDFDPSAEIYRDIASWMSAGAPRRAATLGDRPGGEAGQPERHFAGALDEPDRQRRIGR